MHIYIIHICPFQTYTSFFMSIISKFEERAWHHILSLRLFEVAFEFQYLTLISRYFEFFLFLITSLSLVFTNPESTKIKNANKTIYKNNIFFSQKKTITNKQFRIHTFWIRQNMWWPRYRILIYKVSRTI